MAMTERRTLIIVGVVIIAAVSAIVIIYRSLNERYYVTSTGKGEVYRIDRRTGKTWLIEGSTMEEVTDAQSSSTSTQRLSDVPASALAKISGRAGYSVQSLFAGKLYNGSNWYVERIRIRVFAVSTDVEEGSAWSRYFNDDIYLSPEATGTFQVDTLDGQLHNAVGWEIVSGQGFEW